MSFCFSFFLVRVLEVGWLFKFSRKFIEGRGQFWVQGGEGYRVFEFVTSFFCFFIVLRCLLFVQYGRFLKFILTCVCVVFYSFFLFERGGTGGVGCGLVFSVQVRGFRWYRRQVGLVVFVGLGQRGGTVYILIYFFFRLLGEGGFWKFYNFV